MAGGGGTTTTQSTQNVNMGPWQPQQQYVQNLFGRAENAYQNDPLQAYTGQIVAPLTGAQNQGLNNIINTASNGSPLLGASNNLAQNTLNGQYLNPSSNPYLQDTFNAASDAVTNAYQTATAPQTSSAMEAAGRYGSGAYGQMVNQNQKALGSTLNNLAANIYGGNYQNERQNQLNTMNNTGNLMQNAYIDPNMLLQAGGIQQQQQQNVNNANYQQFQQNQMLPWQTIQMYQGLVNGNYGQSGTVNSTQQTPYYSNPLGSILGGALSLGSLAVPGLGGVSAIGNILSGLRGAAGGGGASAP